MRTLLVTGSDTGVGKTHVVAALARLLAGSGDPAVCAPRIQIVKVVETGTAGFGPEDGDAATARRLATLDGCGAGSTPGESAAAVIEAFTLASYGQPVAPAAAAAADGREVSFAALVDAVAALPPCDWRILEGAGGVATPVDATRDWADFGRAVGADALVVVVADRLGAINQGRLAFARATQAGTPAGLWLNATAAVDPLVARSTRAGLRAARLPLWAEQPCGAVAPLGPAATLAHLLAATARPDPAASALPPEPAAAAALPASANAVPLEQRAATAHLAERSTRIAPAAAPAPSPSSPASLSSLSSFSSLSVPFPPAHPLIARCAAALAERDRLSLRRSLRVSAPEPGLLNLADNDYLALAHDPAIAQAVAAAAAAHGTSASASPLITGWRAPHAELTARLAAWHGLPCGMLWTSGYAANAAILGGLPARGDLVFADRLIHASMIAGLLRSGARVQRYEHLALDRLEALLAAVEPGRPVIVATETVFSMDGDYPDLRRFADLKRRYGFFWVVDEAHGLGWYGPQGAGLIRAAGVAEDVDVLVGTLGKALGSGGAYALFRDERVRDHLVNTAGEFVYSTALPPTSVAAAAVALGRIAALAPEQPAWHAASRAFRARLRGAGWAAPDGDSPIVPVRLDDPAAAVALVAHLRQSGILAGAVRPPTVPAGTSRVRFSLKRTFTPADADRVLAAMDDWRRAR